MSEDFLHYLWKFQCFRNVNVSTEQNQAILIIHPGYHNVDSGPDFSEARVYIGEQLWAGNVEIHIRSSDWFRHGHESDPAYENVILHVVYEDDRPIHDPSGNLLPTLVLKDLFDEGLYWKYEQLLHNQTAIPCQNEFPKVDGLIVESMLERSLVERLQSKSREIQKLLEKNNNDWNETFYQWMARGFGLKINAEPMLLLARMLPLRILARHKDNLFQLEALLFGTAGMLPGEEDDYSKQLSREYQFLKHKYGLGEMDASLWKFSRLRPHGFPTIRIAQFAALTFRAEQLFSKILGIGSLKIMEQILGDSPSVYWREHYRFGKFHKRGKAGMGKAFQTILIINVIVPFLFLYGKVKDEDFYCQRALDLLDQLEAEDNKLIRIFRNLGLEPDSAFYSQSLIQLYQQYCSRKKCLNCSIGIHLIGQ